MIIVNVEESDYTIKIGVQGENKARKIVFDFSEWQKIYGEGVVAATVQRPADQNPYPVVIQTNGTKAEWVVQAADTEQVGFGEIQYIYMVDDQIAKTKVIQTYVDKGMESPVDPPAPEQGYVDKVIEAGTKAEQAAQRAEIAQGKMPIIGENGNWFIWDSAEGVYKDSGFPSAGSGGGGGTFSISKVYPSVAAMNADYPAPDVPIGGLVLIDTGDVDDPENAQVYVKTETEFKFLIDLSGSQGIQGKNGISPVVNFAKVEGGTKITVADATGTKEVIIPDGPDGISPTITTKAVDNGTQVTVIDKNGENVFVITNGKDGFSPTAKVIEYPDGSTVTITDRNGTTIANIPNGVSPIVSFAPTEQGTKITVTDAAGEKTVVIPNGKDGNDGTSPTAKVIQDPDGATVTVIDATGTTTAKIKNGKDAEGSGLGDWKLLREVKIPAEPASDTSGIIWTVDDQNRVTGFEFDTDADGNFFAVDEIQIYGYDIRAGSNEGRWYRVRVDDAERDAFCLPAASGSVGNRFLCCYAERRANLWNAIGSFAAALRPIDFQPASNAGFYTDGDLINKFVEPAKKIFIELSGGNSPFITNGTFLIWGR